MLLMLVLLGAVVAGIAYWKFAQIQKGMAMAKSFAAPPSAVTTVVVAPQPWHGCGAPRARRRHDDASALRGMG